jgi:hypothetical protein
MHVISMQALSGFLFVVTCDGEVFYASHTVEQYLGFHQVTVVVCCKRCGKTPS